MKRTIFFISDGTGITAETLGHTLLTQFDNIQYRRITLPFVDNLEKVHNAGLSIQWAEKEDGLPPIVFSSFTDQSLLQSLESCANASIFDIFNYFIASLEKALGQSSLCVKGRSHGIVDNDSYDVRMEAINFALSNDDGATLDHYQQADVILLGVSRTGKTPTCIYLAMQFGIRAANYPLTQEVLNDIRLPVKLRPFRKQLFGLTITPERLHMLRSERRPNSSYSSLSTCRQEIQSAEALYRQERIPFLSTTTVSIEEIATRIVQEKAIARRIH